MEGPPLVTCGGFPPGMQQPISHSIAWKRFHSGWHRCCTGYKQHVIPRTPAPELYNGNWRRDFNRKENLWRMPRTGGTPCTWFIDAKNMLIVLNHTFFLQPLMYVAPPHLSQGCIARRRSVTCSGVPFGKHFSRELALSLFKAVTRFAFHCTR